MILNVNIEKLKAFIFLNPSYHICAYDKNTDYKELQRIDKLSICNQIVRDNRPANIRIFYFGFGNTKHKHWFNVNLSIKQAKEFLKRHG